MTQPYETKIEEEVNRFNTQFGDAMNEAAPFAFDFLHESYTRIATHAVEAREREIRERLMQEVRTLWVFGQGQRIKGPYSDERFRGPSMETASWIKKRRCACYA